MRSPMSPAELDDQCRRWRHHERQIQHCPNPRCPSRAELPLDLVDVEASADVTDELERIADER